MIHKAKTIFFIATVIAVGTAFPFAGRAIEYGGIGGRPAYPRPDNPRTQDIFVYTLEPGSSQSDGIIVINNTAEPKTVMLYSADSTPSTDGGFACKQYLESMQKTSEDKRGVGSWITFLLVPEENTLIDGQASEGTDSDADGLMDVSELELGTDPKDADTDGDGSPDKTEIDQGDDPLQPVVLTLEKESNVIVPFNIAVSPSVDIGEQNGCILVQERPEASDENAEGISIATRTGLRVSVTVPGDIIRQLEIASLTITPQKDGSAILHPSVRNVGTASIDAEVKVITRSLFGAMVAEHGGQNPILRDATSEWNFELAPQFWGGWYTSHLTAAYDRDPSLEPGERGVDHVVLSGPTVKYFLLPSLYALVIYAAVLLALAGLTVLLVIHHKRKLWIKSTWQSYVVKHGDTVAHLAESHHVSWRLIVRVNKLNPPYTLPAGQTIKLPPPAKTNIDGKRPKDPSIQKK